MEELLYLVHRESYELSAWMPSGIGSTHFYSRTLWSYLLHLAVVTDKRAAILATHMQHKVACGVLSERVAIDTLLAEVTVFEYWCLVVVGKITLVYSHLVPQLIAWIQESVDQVPVDGVATHIICYRLVFGPFAVALHSNGYLYLAILVVGKHLVPRVFGNNHFVIGGSFTIVFLSSGCHHHLIGIALLIDAEIGRSNINGQSHTRIIRIYLHLCVGVDISLLVAALT